MLTIGSNFVLEPKFSKEIEKYKCRLVDREGDILFIDYPINMNTNKTAFLLDGTQLKLSYVDGQSAYSFDTEVIGRTKKLIPMIKLFYPGDEYVMKVQRRQYVRVETPVDIAIHPYNKEFLPFTAVTEDISAGGALLLTKNDTLKEGLKIRTILVLPMQNGEYHYLDIKSHVVRIHYQDSGYIKYSIRFEGVTPIERQILMRFSFERQLEMKKKGLVFNE